jgi:hypothetical protein
VIGHKGQREGAGKGDERRKLPCKEIDHGDGKGSEDQRDDSKVPFGFGERIELMGEYEEKGRVKIRRILLVKGNLAFKTVPRIIERMDFIYPEGFSIKGIEPQSKADEKAEKEDKNFFSF